MKSLLLKLGLLYTIHFCIFACSNDSKDKNKQLSDLKAKQVELRAQIQELEESISVPNNGEETKRKDKYVGVLEAKPHPFNYFVQTQGFIEAVDDIMVSAKTMGVLSEVLVKEGNKVKKGQILGRIDNSVSKKSRNELLSSIELATIVFQRQKNLWEQKIGTEMQFLQAKNTKKSLENKLATLNEQIEMGTIKSPIYGSVDVVNVKIGQNVAPGMPAFRVVSTNKFKVKAAVSEAFITSVKVGNKVHLKFFELSEEFEARITFVGKSINSITRTFQVEVMLNSHSNDLRINMGCNMKIVFKTVDNAITVPINAVQEINEQKFVFVSQAKGKQFLAKRKIVEVIGVYGNEAQISGVKAGEKVITTGYQGLNEGEFLNMR